MKKNVPMINKNHQSETRIQMKFTSGSQYIDTLSSCVMNQRADGSIYFACNKYQSFRLLSYNWAGPAINDVNSTNFSEVNTKKRKTGLAGFIESLFSSTTISTSKQQEIPTPASIKLQDIKSNQTFILTFNCTTELDSQLKKLTIYDNKKRKVLPEQIKHNSNTSGTNTPQFCSQCGFKLHIDDVFCANCGQKVRQNETINSITEIKTHENDESHIIFPEWYISISFGASTSKNYDKAVFLAKAAPQYFEQKNNGVLLHQAVYSSKPSEYLAFIKLYELISNWKSTSVIINGSLIDRKIIGNLNYCYGDKCRSGNPDFCKGASYMTENPFGCHRLQISACNNPWWSFYNRVGNKWVLNKAAMKERIDSFADIYYLCPVFDYDNIIEKLNQLPDTLSNIQMQRLQQENFGLTIEL